MGFPKGGEHPLCQIAIGGGVQTPLANSIDFPPRNADKPTAIFILYLCLAGSYHYTRINVKE